MFDRGRKEVAMNYLECPPPDAEPVWFLFIFGTVAFLSFTMCIVAVAIGIYEWRANRCCCRRYQEMEPSPSANPDFTKVEASFGSLEGYGTMNNIEQALPIVDDDDEGSRI